MPAANNIPTANRQADAEANDGLDIPRFLQLSAGRRRRAWAEFNAVASVAARMPHRAHADELRAMQRETKRQKSLVRIERLLAKKSGAAAAMPISGRTAIAFIHSQPPVLPVRAEPSRTHGRRRKRRARR